MQASKEDDYDNKNDTKDDCFLLPGVATTGRVYDFFLKNICNDQFGLVRRETKTLEYLFISYTMLYINKKMMTHADTGTQFAS
jgi:hypothetical protein